MFVTDAVLKSGTVFKLTHPLNIDDMFVTDAVLKFGIFVS